MPSFDNTPLVHGIAMLVSYNLMGLGIAFVTRSHLFQEFVATGVALLQMALASIVSSQRQRRPLRIRLSSLVITVWSVLQGAKLLDLALQRPASSMASSLLALMQYAAACTVTAVVISLGHLLGTCTNAPGDLDVVWMGTVMAAGGISMELCDKHDDDKNRYWGQGLVWWGIFVVHMTALVEPRNIDNDTKLPQQQRISLIWRMRRLWVALASPLTATALLLVASNGRHHDDSSSLLHWHLEAPVPWGDWKGLGPVWRNGVNEATAVIDPLLQDLLRWGRSNEVVQTGLANLQGVAALVEHEWEDRYRPLVHLWCQELVRLAGPYPGLIREVLVDYGRFTLDCMEEWRTNLTGFTARACQRIPWRLPIDLPLPADTVVERSMHDSLTRTALLACCLLWLSVGRSWPRGTVLVRLWALKEGLVLLKRVFEEHNKSDFDNLTILHFCILACVWKGLCLFAGDMGRKSGRLSFSLVVGVLTYLVGMFGTILAELQQFKAEEDSGTCCTTGLWSYSQRPHWLGTTVVWWGIGLVLLSEITAPSQPPAASLHPRGGKTSLAVPTNVPVSSRRRLVSASVVSLSMPILVTYLLVVRSVGSIDATNKTCGYGIDPAYTTFADSTPLLFPEWSLPEDWKDVVVERFQSSKETLLGPERSAWVDAWAQERLHSLKRQTKVAVRKLESSTEALLRHEKAKLVGDWVQEARRSTEKFLLTVPYMEGVVSYIAPASVTVKPARERNTPLEPVEKVLAWQDEISHAPKPAPVASDKIVEEPFAVERDEPEVEPNVNERAVEGSNVESHDTGIRHRTEQETQHAADESVSDVNSRAIEAESTDSTQQRNELIEEEEEEEEEAPLDLPRDEISPEPLETPLEEYPAPESLEPEEIDAGDEGTTSVDEEDQAPADLPHDDVSPEPLESPVEEYPAPESLEPEEINAGDEGATSVDEEDQPPADLPHDDVSPEPLESPIEEYPAPESLEPEEINVGDDSATSVDRSDEEEQPPIDLPRDDVSPEPFESPVEESPAPESLEPEVGDESTASVVKLDDEDRPPADVPRDGVSPEPLESPVEEYPAPESLEAEVGDESTTSVDEPDEEEPPPVDVPRDDVSPEPLELPVEQYPAPESLEEDKRLPGQEHWAPESPEEDEMRAADESADEEVEAIDISLDADDAPKEDMERTATEDTADDVEVEDTPVYTPEGIVSPDVADVAGGVVERKSIETDAEEGSSSPPTSKGESSEESQEPPKKKRQMRNRRPLNRPRFERLTDLWLMDDDAIF